jgi:hypothetical protein
MQRKHKLVSATFPLWSSYLVLLSLWTDPKYLAYRARRVLGRGRGNPAATARANSTQTVDSAGDLDDLTVDLVYLWVEGQDPAHRAKRNHWLREYGLDPVIFNPDVRYIESDELKYSLRSAEAFLPWIRKVFIVTDQQVPSWLDVSNPKVRVVDHTEIASDPGTLPTFNSKAIAAQLHNIPDLAEHFILANDDTFFGQPCRVGDFFARAESGGPAVMKVMLYEDPDHWIVPFHQLAESSARLWMVAWNNMKVFLELRRPWRKVRQLTLHQAYGFQRSALASAARDFPKQYAHVCASRFRNPAEIQFCALAKFHALAKGRAVLGVLPSQVFRTQADMKGFDRSNLPTLFCINEDGGSAGEQPSVLERLFPEPSSFEVRVGSPRGATYPCRISSEQGRTFVSGLDA